MVATGSKSIKVAATPDLLSLARSIASAKPPVDIPYTRLKLIADVIIGRQACAAWYAAQSGLGVQAERSKESHPHFIEVLKNVYGILLSAHKSQRMDKAATVKPRLNLTTDSEAAKSLSNIFSRLNVEEPSDTPLGNTNTSERSATLGSAQAAVSTNAAAQECNLSSYDELRFLLWFFLQEMHDTRQWVRAIWQDFAANKISFLVAVRSQIRLPESCAARTTPWYVRIQSSRTLMASLKSWVSTSV